MVFVNDAAEYAVASDGPVDWHGDWSVVVVGCALVSGLVGSMSVVMPCVGGQDFGCVSLVVNQDAVGALDAGGAHEPVGLEYRVLGLTCGFSGLVRSCCEVVLVGKPVKDRSAAHLVVGEVDHARGLGLCLSWCEFLQRAVWPRCIEMVQVDRKDPG
jgi:hypothetical protein